MRAAALAALCAASAAGEVVLQKGGSKQLSELSVLLRVVNKQSRPLDFTVTGTPLEGDLYGDLLDVRDGSGRRADYIGKIARRVAGVSSKVTLEPGAELAAVVPLWDSYRFERDGTYTVRYSGSEVAVEVEETAGFAQVLSARRNATLGATFSGCTSSEQSSINSAERQADGEVTRARNCLPSGSPSCSSLYTEWFGALTSSRYTSVRNCFSSISSRTSNSNTRYNCDTCRNDRQVYAYVYPSDSSETQYLCGAFWSQAGERANTIVHELSHFNGICRTDDFVYGKSGCRNLARTNPNNAVRNADNYCYFSEEA
eukprot:TRINITY_DN262_c0_g1_i1.p1 TRINITY_DN262_c0_g1~~TRINITY_DN262_c0_g1_i1.p1  ORF type:complete len:335 (+),score=138.63 TRINITY_DN262_c0_g1_i1:65-1006(+)